MAGIGQPPTSALGPVMQRLVVAFDAEEEGFKATGKLIAELRPMIIANHFELAVRALPEGSDSDDLLRVEGAESLRVRLYSAAHWLTWELEQLLAPNRAAPEDLFVLGRCEIAGRKLLALLPAVALRQRVEDSFRRVLGEAPAAPLANPGSSADSNAIVAVRRQ